MRLRLVVPFRSLGQDFLDRLRQVIERDGFHKEPGKSRRFAANTVGFVSVPGHRNASDIVELSEFRQEFAAVAVRESDVRDKDVKRIVSVPRTYRLPTSLEAVAENPLRIGQSLSAEANITLRSRIGRSPYAIRQAEGLSVAGQRDVDSILSQLGRGNPNPGIGTRALGNDFFELRGANGGRVIVRRTGLNSYDVVGKFQGHVRGDAANSQVIQRLMAEAEGN